MSRSVNFVMDQGELCGTDCIEEAAGLAELCALIGQFRLQGVVLVQQVGDQNAD